MTHREASWATLLANLVLVLEQVSQALSKDERSPLKNARHGRSVLHGHGHIHGLQRLTNPGERLAPHQSKLLWVLPEHCRGHQCQIFQQWESREFSLGAVLNDESNDDSRSGRAQVEH